MPNYTLNNTVPEPSRYMDEQGFNNVPATPGAGIPAGQGVLTQAHPLEDHVVDHSNTVPMDFPTPAGDYARRTY